MNIIAKLRNIFLFVVTYPVYWGQKLFFSNHVEDYKDLNYWNNDEIYLSNKYIKGKILIIGCGAGRSLGHIKGDVVAIDNVSGMVDIAKEKYPEIDIRLMDATNMDFEDDTFDSIFFPFHGMSFVKNKNSLYSEVSRVLKPGGVAVLNAGNRFFLKSFREIFKNVVEVNGLDIYRSSFLEKIKLKKYFKSVNVIYRVSIQKSRNYKDVCYKIFPIFSKSIYFICKK